MRVARLMSLLVHPEAGFKWTAFDMRWLFKFTVEGLLLGVLRELAALFSDAPMLWPSDLVNFHHEVLQVD